LKAIVEYNSRKITVNISEPIDISIPIDMGKKNINAWDIDGPKIEAEKSDEDEISVANGAVVNFNAIHFNPHSHITHTECVGHITEKVHSVNKNLKYFIFLAELVTVAPLFHNGDFLMIKHLLIDLPSVDKEKDDGKLLSHNAFWNTAGELRMDATITEFIYVPNHVEDGEYLLNLMIAPFENDATPSKPVLYQIEK